jgi:hypothetical protein
VEDRDGVGRRSVRGLTIELVIEDRAHRGVDQRANRTPGHQLGEAPASCSGRDCADLQNSIGKLAMTGTTTRERLREQLTRRDEPPAERSC